MLTYCTNIHPGETWDEITGTVWDQVLRVKERVSPGEPFPVGLRLSARAARRGVASGAERFLDRCSGDGCFIPTLNGFPYGRFHGAGVKERAYLPDWRGRERVDYTGDLVRLLRLWLPNGVTGSISTVPVGLGEFVEDDELPLVRSNIITVLRDLENTAAAGKTIILALEPEPGCVLETVADVVEFIEKLALPAALRPFLGVCYDCCHGAVAGENPQEAFTLLAQAGIPVAKIQVSSAVRLVGPQLRWANLFCDDLWLHQTRVKSDEGEQRFADLREALLTLPERRGEWLIHYHLPVYHEGTEQFGTTSDFIRRVLSASPKVLLELETYTYEFLPPQLRHGPAIDSICREFRWLKGGA
jgi:hypothetical protein